MLQKKIKNRFDVRSALVLILLCCVGTFSAQAQGVSGGLGKMLVDKAGESAAGGGPPAPPAAPALSNQQDQEADVSLPMELLEGVELPQMSQESVLDKVDSDVEAELKRLEEAQGKMPSILFSERESERLDQAIQIYNSGNFDKKKEDRAFGPGDGDEKGEDPLMNVEIPDRDLVLGGISYGNGENWVIWLNKQRLTPTRLPAEIKFIKVLKGHVDLKWQDKLTQQLISVRLRPNQRFNLDSRMFLPGTAP